MRNVLFQLLVLRSRTNRNIFRLFSNMEPLSALSFIEVKDASNPGSLLHEWVQEAKQNGSPPFVMNLATSTKNGEVSTRNVVIREILPDASATFTAQSYSHKMKDIHENPQVAASILLNYKQDNKNIVRQINLMGLAEKMTRQQCRLYFEKFRLPAKIRSWIAQDCGPVDWNEIKTKHDALLKEVEGGKVLEMPDTVVAYKIVPRKVDFYYSFGEKIGDRIIFEKDNNGLWKYERVMP